ncbi:MAG: M48 family metallopeptidase [Bacteroidales bacterium]|jgi:predicted metal-dependent hydrolase|nr:M48 family metallopeptidase [Bacteroidales bacterium]
MEQERNIIQTGWQDKTDFKACVHDYATKMNVSVKSLSLRPMKNKWASCSTDGNLNFNKELLDMEKDLGEYVIVHELLHFSVPNHGKLWKSLMRAYLGDYEKSEERLKKCITEKATFAPDKMEGND